MFAFCYYLVVNVISNRGLAKLIQSHPDCGEAAMQWFHKATRRNWDTLQELGETFPSVDQVGQVLIFNLRGNSYRLIVTVYWPAHVFYVKALLSHAECDRKEWMQWA
ncbi:MAG: type II toxin-antitoxin system HigB family toxin [Acidobacteria bacterium]|nr:type II toxin-antitoxin system HigB family toxin [Acidobacteriota bacterium]